MGFTSFGLNNGDFSSVVVEAWQLKRLVRELRHRKEDAL
jgi:hypothetical protein